MKLIESQLGLCEALGVSKGTVSKYVRRPDWPVSSSPPWDADDLAIIENWRACLQEDRAREHRRKSAEELEAENAEIREMIQKLTGLSYEAWVREAINNLRSNADRAEREIANQN